MHKKSLFYYIKCDKIYCRKGRFPIKIFKQKLSFAKQ